jgi:hypothetical protein
VFFAGFNEHVTVAFWADANRGNYMFHCHNLIHEDDDMLLAFTVTHEAEDESGEQKFATDDDAEIGVVPIARPDSDAIGAPPFEEAFPFDTRVTPGESAEDGDSEGFERAKRYVYPKSFGSNKGVMTANGFMFEYEKLHDVPSPVGAHATQAIGAINELFGAGGEGRFGKFYEKDGAFFASGATNEGGDLLLDASTEPAQTLRAVDVDAKFFPTA